MPSSNDLHEIYLEIGQKKVFAIAVHWPGWCRFGKDEETAVQRLMETAPRYARIAKQANLDFIVPDTIAQLNITAHLDGNSTTDFGAPDRHLPHDWDPLAAGGPVRGFAESVLASLRSGGGQS